MTRFFLYCILSLLPFTGFSQEYLLPLGCNLNYYYKDLKHENLKTASPDIQFKPSSGSLELPFKEDFFYCTSNSYPNQNKWADSLVYINHGFGIAPPSIGVATFDGLNKYGYPYSPNLVNVSSCLPCDTLTSRPINLYTKGTQTLDPSAANVGFSFFYQAKGNGDNPEVTDSLLLDFYKPTDSTWNMVWHSRGNTSVNSADSIFKYAFVKVKDPGYFKDGFKFRFRNWGSQAGNFDNWSIDYIFLDTDRSDSLKDTVNYDIAFGQIPTSFLLNYSAMPKKQYTSGEMAPNISVRIRNNYNSNFNIGYKYQVTDPSGSHTYNEYNGGFGLITPFDTNGYHNFPTHSAPTTTVSGPFVMPPLDSVDFTIKHNIFPGTSGSVVTTDFFPENDTLVQFQRFRNYYAVDDGSCEAGYYVLGVKAKMAVKIGVNYLDSLRGLRIFFDPVGYVNTISANYKFRITVWEDQNGLPGNVFYRDSTYYTPTFINKQHASPFIEYNIDSAGAGFRLIPPGTYYVGYEQFNATGTITVGFDRNYIRNNSLFYNVGDGWKNSVIKGSIMLRPVFGKKIPHPVGVSEYAAPKENMFKVFPNPCNALLTIRSADTENASYLMYNTTGQLIAEGLLTNSEQNINTGELSPGMYFLQLHSGGRMIQQQKIIISH